MADQSLRVRLIALTQGFNRNMQVAQARLTTFGQRSKQVGASLRSIQLPLLLAGGAAVKMAADFDRSMTQIKSLVGVASDEVDRMGEKVKSMSSNIGVSSTESAEALFFITSAGLRGSEAMDVLNASMKAAAIGLGDTKTVADLATSAMNAYGSDVLSATDATDVMVSAVREGKLEASELAGSMGRVLPVASAMGVRFDEVGAAFAALSRTGTNAAEAATQIRGILTSLLKPTKEASDTLAEMGLNTQNLRQQIKEEGLLAALETLKRNFDGNDEAAQKVFGNVRALSGIMDLLGANVQTTRDIFDSMTKSAGATNTAFEVLQDSAEYKLRKSMIEVKNSFTETGAVILEGLLPHIKSLADSIKGLFEDFRNLDEDTQKAYITLGEIIIVAPLIASAIGTITAAVGGLTTAFRILAGINLVRLGPILALLSARGDERSDYYSEVMLQAELALAAEDRYTDSLEGQEAQAKATATALDKLLPPLTKTQQKLSQIGTGKTIDPKELFKDLLDQEDLNNALKASSALDEMLAGDSNLTFALAKDAASVEYFGNVVKNTAEEVRTPLEIVSEKVQEMSQFTQNLLLGVGQALRSAFEQAMTSGENFVTSLGKMLKDLIKRLLAAAAAAFILSKAFPSLGSFGSIFGALSGFGGLGGGGINASASIPTNGVLSPNIAGRDNVLSVAGQFRLDGQDLVVAVQRASNQRSNFIG